MNTSEPQERPDAIAIDGVVTIEERLYPPLWMVIALTMLTSGLYQLVWSYRSWRDLRREFADGSMNPLAHAAAMLLPVYDLDRLYEHFDRLRLLAIRRCAPYDSPAAMTALFATALGLALASPFAPTPLQPVAWFASLVLLASVIGSGQLSLQRYLKRTYRFSRESSAALDWALLVIGLIWTSAVVLGTAGRLL